VKGLDKDGEAGRLRHTMFMSQAEVGMAQLDANYGVKWSVPQN
jgi:hypothetical protein